MKNKLVFILVFTLGTTACKVIQPYRRAENTAPGGLYRDTLESSSAARMVDSAKTAAGDSIRWASDSTRRARALATSRPDTTTIATLPWRTMFTDTLLQALIQQGIDSNFDFRDRRRPYKRVREANFSGKSAGAAFFPSLGALTPGATLQGVPGTSGNSQTYQAYPRFFVGSRPLGQTPECQPRRARQPAPKLCL